MTFSQGTQTNFDPASQARFRRWRRAAGVIVAAGAVLVLFGWLFNIAVLKSVLPHLAPMRPITAVCLLLAGLALWLWPEKGRGWRGRVVMGCAGVIALVGLLTLAEYGAGWSFGIDDLLFRDALRLQSFPGRMGPHAALTHVLIGAAFLLARSSKRRARWSQGFALLAGVIAFIVLVGYVFSLTRFIVSTENMALNTSLCFLVLVFAILCLRPEVGVMRLATDKSIAGTSLRRTLLIMVVTLLVLPWLIEQGERAGLYRAELGLPLFVVTGVIMMAWLVWWKARTLARLEAALREGEAREHARAEELAAVMKVAPAAIWVAHDLACRQITGNDVGHALLRVPPGDNLSKSAPVPEQPQHFTVYENGRELAAGELPMQRAARGEAVAVIEVEHRFDTGESIFLFGGTAPLKDAEGQNRGAVGVFIDITDRKQHEAERERLLAQEQQARAAAEAATRAKDEFVSVVSHELRNPLNSILGYARLARTNPHDVPTVERSLEIIERNARIQQQLIDDLLDIARISSGKLQIEPRPVDLIAILDDVLDVVRPAAQAKGITLIGDFSREPQPLNADPNRLQQIVWNLLQNAVKFTPAGGRVTLQMRPESDQVRLVVSDTGQGIAPEFLPTIFDRFSQNDMARTRRHGGLGLGLALARQLTELHGGTIAAASTGVGQGATFTVTLPLSVPLADDPLPPRALVEVNTGPDAIPLADLPRLDGTRVLVVDDEEEARLLLTNALTKWGATVTTAAGGAEAFAWLMNAQFDVLVCDIAMPDEDGYSVLRRIRASEYQRGVPLSQCLPAIALTGRRRAEDRLQALSAGFQMYVAKPVELAELIMVIASLTGNRQKGARSEI